MQPPRTGARRIVLLTVLIILLSYLLYVSERWDVRLETFEDGSGHMMWCDPSAICDSEKE